MTFFLQPAIAAPDLSKQIGSQVNAGAKKAGLGQPKDIRESAASLIQIFLGFLATFFLILIIMSGYWLITARGNDQKHTKAMDTMRRAVIGFIVIIMAYGISLVVGNLVKGAVNVDDGKTRCGFVQRTFGWTNLNCKR